MAFSVYPFEADQKILNYISNLSKELFSFLIPSSENPKQLLSAKNKIVVIYNMRQLFELGVV